MFGDATDEISKHEKDEPIRISGFHNFGFGGSFKDVKHGPVTDITSSIVTLDNPVDISDNTAHSGRSPTSASPCNSPLPGTSGKGYVMGKNRQNSLYA